MKSLALALLLLAASAGAQAQSPARVYRPAAAGDHYEIVRETSFAGVEVQDQDGRATVKKLFDEEMYRSDLQVGDVITGIGELTVSNAKSWEAAMDKITPEQKVTVRVLRNGKALEVPVKLRKIPVFGKVI